MKDYYTGEYYDDYYTDGGQQAEVRASWTGYHRGVYSSNSQRTNQRVLGPGEGNQRVKKKGKVGRKEKNFGVGGEIK